MREDELRSILLVKAIEETDGAGTLLPPADRVAAAREAQRAAREAAGSEAMEEGALSEAAQRMGVERARILIPKVVARHPFLNTVSNLSGGSAAAGAVVVALGVVVGVALSALDGTRRINVLAFPVLGVVAWNLVTYAAIFAGWMRARHVQGPRRRVPEMLAHLATSRVSRLVAKSGAFNAPLAEALGRFTREWFAVAQPLLVARAARLLHLSAAALGIGLIAGLYVRGIAFDYHAGWESTFLDASRARALLSVIYGPASLVTGIAIPDAAALEAIRWQDAAGGERAAPWIHLLAATVALFVVVPRLALSLAGTLFITRWSRRAPLPASLAAYFRGAFGALGGSIGRGLATVVPYAYEPSADARAGLRALLPRALGESLTVDSRAAVRYGEEDEFVRGLDAAGKADVVVLLFNLAATPEEENHGDVIAGVRGWLAAAREPRPQLLVLVDEGPYAERMASDGATGRVAERRDAWQQFVAGHGLAACSVNLAAAGRVEISPEQVELLRGALWQSQPA
jgi:hypothetical protein